MRGHRTIGRSFAVTGAGRSVCSVWSPGYAKSVKYKKIQGGGPSGFEGRKSSNETARQFLNSRSRQLAECNGGIPQQAMAQTLWRAAKWTAAG